MNRSNDPFACEVETQRAIGLRLSQVPGACHIGDAHPARVLSLHAANGGK